jgi:hypothetical protein
MKEKEKSKVKVIRELTAVQMIAAAKKTFKNSFKTELTKSFSMDDIVLLKNKFGGTMDVSIDEMFSSKLKETIMAMLADKKKPLEIIAFLKEKKYILCDSSVYNYETEFKAMNLSA